MYSDSVLYTIGTALNRAHDNNVDVQILVEGQWLTGRVAAVDGHGVVLHADHATGAPGGDGPMSAEHSVIRMGSVSAVRVFAAAPHHQPLPGAHNANGASRPMPSS